MKLIFHPQLSRHRGALIRIQSAGTSAQYHKMVKMIGDFMEQMVLFMDASLKSQVRQGTVVRPQNASPNISSIIMKRSSKL
jgi:hypothetical protein